MDPVSFEGVCCFLPGYTGRHYIDYMLPTFALTSRPLHKSLRTLLACTEWG